MDFQNPWNRQRTSLQYENEEVKMERVDLLRFFYSRDSSEKELEKLRKALDHVADPGVHVLALEGLFRIEGVAQRVQLPHHGCEIEFIKRILGEWLNGRTYSEVLGMKPLIPGGFTIFKALDIHPIGDEVCESKLQGLIRALGGVDPTVALLTLEGLFCSILSLAEVTHSSGVQCDGRAINDMRDILREWRSNSPLDGAYSGVFRAVPRVLRSLTIFKTLEVPLFIDDYGSKKQLSSYGATEDIRIDGNTPIFHITHRKEAEGIVKDKHFKPSSAKNMIEGTWFGLDKSESVYGSHAFETTLYELGVTGLHQGEIVAYKNEVNVILYAAKDTHFREVRKPTDQAVRRDSRHDAYVKVSVFVPSRFLPAGPVEFGEVIRNTEVKHGPFCVKEKRLGIPCEELTFYY